MVLRRMLCIAALVAMVPAAPPAGAAPPRSLPAPVVIRIPASAARPMMPIDADAPVPRAEFATSVRTPSDRALLRREIERMRADEARRFAAGAGPGIVVPLRRSKY